MSKIHISSDFLMTQESEQLSNLRWVTDLLNRPVEEGAGVKPTPFIGHDTASNSFNRLEFFQLSDLSLDMQATHTWFDPAKITEASKKFLSNFISSEDLVIGYELSKQTRFILDSMGITYIDLWLHPVRFMDDIMFAMGSNNSNLGASLAQGEINSRTMQLYADRLKIQSYKGWERKDPIIVDNSALFVGQTLNDKSVLKDGRFHSVLDFRAEMTKLSESHNHVYYSRHPFLKSGDEAELEFVLGLPNTSITSLPSYKLICHPRINCVAGLSSSVLTEAKLMDKETLQLMQSPYTLKALQGSPDAYATRMHEVIDPSFWNTILSTLSGHPFFTQSRSPESVSFIDGKDKLRDMLGFYWGYGDIDKTENMRVAKIKSAAAAKPASGTISSRQSSANITAIKRKIENADVVAFDIFDTLVERTINSPNDLFGLIAPSTDKVVANLSSYFTDLRKRARKLAENAAFGEEVLLKDRYKAIADKASLNAEQETALYNLEVAAEEQVLRPRWVGKELYQYACQAGKRVILVSDTFFEPEVIHNILENCGYSEHAKSYLSSEAGALKATGNLFGTVIKEEGVDPSSILMIGDNGHSDVTQAKAFGLEACHIPDKARISTDASPALMRALRDISDAHTKTIATGLVSHKYTQAAIPNDAGFTRGDVTQLGYGVLGPMFAGFGKWILDNAREREITDIYFLARDGAIAKKCYEAIATDNAPAPRAHYIYASRRSSRVAALETVSDILNILETSFSPTPLKSIIESRFGIDISSVSPAILRDFGFQSTQQIVQPIDNYEALTGLVSHPEVAALILANAKTEREELLAYYAEHDLHESRIGRKIAFVDIGHSGTIQQSLCKLLKLEETTGLYFATFEGIKENLGSSTGLGYYASNISSEDRAHPYKRNLLMFETAFLNEDRSFVRIKEGSPVFLDSAEDETRSNLSRELHASIAEFCEDLTSILRHFEVEIKLTPEEATAPFLGYLSEPSVLDASIFKGIGFENQYSGRSASWIIPTDANLPAIWKAGAETLRGRKAKIHKGTGGKRKGATLMPEPDHLTHRLFSAGVEILLSQAKRRKFRTKRDRFFNDSKSAVVRMFGAAVYGGPDNA
ncbi:HAD family hydrolase [Sulfitobacter sp. R18_1]|uniref:HAD family hydrolase n=1 Tax=Sulfitobacter sp. R18_1 TaxID=2821104 RepID=UPI001ADB82BF|nr:HAD family hydrolase [Sulfitobacter sp. R18_1]MBO9428593.1 hypothetical protein [Sulfitobacter sp. R18_1]